MTTAMRQRDLLIVERHRNGGKLAVIAREFGISGERVRQIAAKERRRNREARNARNLLKSVCDANDLDRPWKRLRLITAIGYNHKVRGVVTRHCHPEGKDITLRQLMDWCLPAMTRDSDFLWDWVPAYGKPNFALHSVRNLLLCMDTADLGVNFRLEWEERRRAFRTKFATATNQEERALA